MLSVFSACIYRPIQWTRKSTCGVLEHGLCTVVSDYTGYTDTTHVHVLCTSELSYVTVRLLDGIVDDWLDETRDSSQTLKRRVRF